MYRFYCMTVYHFVMVIMLTTSIITSQQAPEQKFYYAIKHGFMDNAFGYLQRTDLDFDYIDPQDRQTCLECAIKHGQSGIIYGLVKKDIDVNRQHNQAHETPLHQAVYTQDESIVGLLLQHADIDLERRDASSLTPLQLASILGYARISGMLRDHKDLKIDRLRSPMRSVSSSERFSTFSTNAKSGSDFEQNLLDEQKNKEKCAWFSRWFSWK